MDVTILGSCTVIQYPQDIELFFNQLNLVDVRHGSRMEMDALPLLFLADMAGDELLRKRIVTGLLKNLEDSGGDLWKCGMWGHDEVHLRFSSVALRLMLLNQQEFDDKLVIHCLANHLSHHEKSLGGVWFYHDSIETNKQAYYKTWSGKAFDNASANNMLILNTHIDTLVTLFLAKSKGVDVEQVELYIADAIKALETYFLQAQTVSGVRAVVDRFARNTMLRGLGNRDLWSRGSVYLLNRFYYRGLRYAQKQKYSVRAFNDGFLERDIRLTGPSLEYHIVNIWDMARLLLWMEYTDFNKPSVTSKLMTYAEQGLRYCFESSPYRDYLQRISKSKGISNELLEAIAIVTVLGKRNTWLADLYLDWRTFAVASPGILGIDKTISGDAVHNMSLACDNKPEHLDWIPFDNNMVFVANHGEVDYPVDLAKYDLNIIGSQKNGGNTGASINAQTVAILTLR